MIPRYQILNSDGVQCLHEASLEILSRVGIRVHHDDVLTALQDAGAQVHWDGKLVRIGEELVHDALGKCTKQYTLYGRDGSQTARLGFGDIVTMSSPGQYSWLDWRRPGQRYAPTTREFHQAVLVGDALENIDIVGAMTQPVDVPEPIRDIFLTAELAKRTAKPTRVWIKDGTTARYILEIYRILAGGEDAMRQRPPVEAFIEPISPLTMPATGMDILVEFCKVGLPVSFGPMVQSAATGPATLAGTLAQENAEVLAALVITQTLRVGTPVMYGGIPHIMDPRTTMISFASPEQALMAAAMSQMAKHYGLPVYLNTGLGDSKVVDAQAGLERGMTFLMGALCGGDLLGHMGIAGADQAASLVQLVVDNEMISYVKRVVRGMELSPESLALDVIAEVGPGGNFMPLIHTVKNYRKEFWLPSTMWDRGTWESWVSDGGLSMSERAQSRVEELLRRHQPEPLDDAIAREIDSVVAAASKQLLG